MTASESSKPAVAPAVKKPMTAKEPPPFKWKLVGYVDGLTVTLLKSPEKDEVDSQRDRLAGEGYYRSVTVYPIDAKVPPDPLAAKFKKKPTPKPKKAAADKPRRGSAKKAAKSTAKRAAAPKRKAKKAAPKPAARTTTAKKATSRATTARKQATRKTARAKSAAKSKRAASRKSAKTSRKRTGTRK